MRRILTIAGAVAVLSLYGCDISGPVQKQAKADCNCATTPPAAPAVAPVTGTGTGSTGTTGTTGEVSPPAGTGDDDVAPATRHVYGYDSHDAGHGRHIVRTGYHPRMRSEDWDHDRTRGHDRHGHHDRGYARWHHGHVWYSEWSELTVATYDYHSGSTSSYFGYTGGTTHGDSDGAYHGGGDLHGDHDGDHHGDHDGGYHTVDRGWVDGYGRSHGAYSGGVIRYSAGDDGRDRPWHGYDADCPDNDPHHH